MSTPEVILCDDSLHPAALGSLVSLGTFDELAHHPAAIDVDPERQLQEALESKTQGNSLFAKGEYREAFGMYSLALKVCPADSKYANDRAVFHCNRAACSLHLGDLEDARDDCDAAIELNPKYLKALLRRAQLNEKLDNLDDALRDLNSSLEIDPSLHSARRDAHRLDSIIKERNEKLKAEMLGKLKDLGNTILGKFGMSTDNFKMVQDPGSGSYNIQFVQNPKGA